MVSKESEQFLTELRFYLMSKGKNDDEINEITEELEVHLMEAEADGKDVSYIIGDSPKQYMKSIGESMSTDYRQMAGLVPLMILLLGAYVSVGPAIEGNFSLSKGMLWIAIIAGSIAVGAYSLLIFRVLPKFLHSKWSAVLLLGASVAMTGLMVMILLWNQKQGFEPIFTATPFQNNVIVAVCAVIFIVSAIYTKTWFTIIIPLFLSVGPIANRFIPQDVNEDPTYILYTLIAFVIIAAFMIFIFMAKRKKMLNNGGKRNV
ncbi:hypothetical protein LIT38_02465 [Bacillus sp. CMF12]|uniref:hypothetical protein n=1 Tax=Bacillaceae TaxID=186817 RepID=UPI001FB3F5AB|nr:MULTISPECIES: hypothetical protein [Bacillaceae]UOE55914.1 hypothetical protein IRB79_03670 [Cytobacillus oceanisediminis]USK50374.1 hypothetical protein LIT38_02465 [Bacillus sp. CMF12]